MKNHQPAAAQNVSCSLQSLWIERTTLILSHPLPGISRWFEVEQRELVRQEGRTDCTSELEHPHQTAEMFAWFCLVPGGGEPVGERHVCGGKQEPGAPDSDQPVPTQAAAREHQPAEHDAERRHRCRRQRRHRQIPGGQAKTVCLFRIFVYLQPETLNPNGSDNCLDISHVFILCSETQRTKKTTMRVLNVSGKNLHLSS